MAARLARHILLVAILFCATVLDSASAIRAEGFGIVHRQGETCIEQHTPQSGLLTEQRQRQPSQAVRSSSPLPRLASSRPVRLLPTHGGKPTHQTSRWNKSESLSQNLLIAFSACCGLQWPCTSVPSPRLRYVIALRRLLC